MSPRSRDKPRGAPRIYDRDKILKLIDAGIKDSVIAKIIGCTTHYIWKLRTDKNRKRVIW